MRKSQQFRKYNKLKFRKKRSILKNRFFWSFILVLISFLVSFYLIGFHSIFQIEKVEISGNQKVSTENIRDLIEINLPKKILFFSSRSIFLVDLKEINENLLNKFPQIGKIDFDRDFPDKLIILIEERKPVAIFEERFLSKEDIMLEGGATLRREKSHFFIDEQGIVFEKVSEKGSWLVIKDPSLNQDMKLGERIIKEEKLSQILKIKSELEKSKIGINSAEIVNHQRVNIKTLEGWEVYFNLLDDVSQQVFNLDLVLKEKISSEERGNLEYVDLRFGNQVYYK